VGGRFLVYLTTREEERMLDGEEGEAKRLAMEILVKLAEAYKAERLIEVKSCHVVNTCYKDVMDAGLEIVEKFPSNTLIPYCFWLGI